MVDLHGGISKGVSYNKMYYHLLRGVPEGDSSGGWYLVAHCKL